MAVWETAQPVAKWLPNGSLRRIPAEIKVVRITDGKTDETTFEVGEAVKMVTDRGRELDATFLGTVTVDGVVYPVVSDAANERFVVGLDLGAVSVTTLADADLDESAFTACFFPGTLIATPSGERKVEELDSGDTILVRDSGAIPATRLACTEEEFLQRCIARAVPVKWIGHQTISSLIGPAERLMPVRFAAGSLGDGLPHSDLTVTADHAMLVDGILCEAGALVNGTSIALVPLSEFGERCTVYHVETEAHEILLANGAPAETFVDNVSRRAFDNFAEFEALHGDTPEMKELSYPRAANARHLPARIKNRLSVGNAEKPRKAS